MKALKPWGNVIRFWKLLVYLKAGLTKFNIQDTWMLLGNKEKLGAAKKELVELKPSKIPKKKLKFNESNRRFGNDITNSIKNNAQINNGHHSFHQKSSSIPNKVRKNI